MRVKGYVERDWSPRKGSNRGEAGAPYRWIATWLEEYVMGDDFGKGAGTHSLLFFCTRKVLGKPLSPQES